MTKKLMRSLDFSIVAGFKVEGCMVGMHQGIDVLGLGPVRLRV